MLVPEISIQDLQYLGFHTGMKSMPQLIEELAPDVEFADMIFFDDAAVATMHTQVINEAIDLAKKFGSNDSGRFVNGVLDQLAKQRA